MIKIIFLDIDGVLNYINTQGSSDLLDKDCLINLQTIINQTNAKIILSSSWRYDSTITNKLIKIFEELNPKLLLHGSIPVCSANDFSFRLINIILWLKDNKTIKRFAIIDDRDLFKISNDNYIPNLVDLQVTKSTFKNSFFKTNPNIGLDISLTHKIIDYLNQ